MEHWWGGREGKTEVPAEKPVPVQLCPPQITHWGTSPKWKRNQIFSYLYLVLPCWTFRRGFPNKKCILKCLLSHAFSISRQLRPSYHDSPTTSQYRKQNHAVHHDATFYSHYVFSSGWASLSKIFMPIFVGQWNEQTNKCSNLNETKANREALLKTPNTKDCQMQR